MNFGDAFEQVARGGKVMCLEVWADDKFIVAQYPDENSKMKHPYLYETGNFVSPWVPSTPELFSECWMVFNGE
jgi:hypothetical protein